MGVFRDVQPAVDHKVVVSHRSQIQSKQKVADHSSYVGKPVRIAIEIAQHHIVLGIEIGIGSVLREKQGIEEEFVFLLADTAEQGATGARQCLFFDLAQDAEQ